VPSQANLTDLPSRPKKQVKLDPTLESEILFNPEGFLQKKREQMERKNNAARRDSLEGRRTLESSKQSLFTRTDQPF